MLVRIMIGISTAAPLAGAQVGMFVEHESFGGKATIAIAWGDADGDGDFDLAVANTSGGANGLYLNDGVGGFAGGNAFGNKNTFAAVWADFDNDGDLDLAIGNGSNAQNYLEINNGDGTFTEQPEFGLRSTVAMAWADFDLDGDLDLAVGNGILGSAQPNALYVNNGDGTFTARDEFGMLRTDSVAWGDFDGDGDPDLAVGNGGFSLEEPNALYINNGDGTFTARDEFGLGDTSAVAWADADGDGDLDLAVMNWNNGQSMLYRNNGDGTFNGEPAFGIGDPNTGAWGDFDNDGDLDLAQGNGDFTSAAQNLLWINDGSGVFTPEGQFGLGSTDAVAWADADGDGDLDLAAGNEHTPTTNYFYENTTPALGGAIGLQLRGRFAEGGAGYSNRDGVGAIVTFYGAGHVGDPGFLLGAREVSATGGFTSQGASEIHFGLGSRQAVDARIAWPGSAGSHLQQDLLGLAAGTRWVIEETAPCPADFNHDGQVNTIDVLTFLNAWVAHDPSGDFNHDGSINTIDVLAFLNAFTSGCS
ncbi:MAG: CRTAC1 family protein [Phycisphaerales bacterium]|nr:CRTAC1 family protein [Phycisphaerales bacterium]